VISFLLLVCLIWKVSRSQRRSHTGNCWIHPHYAAKTVSLNRQFDNRQIIFGTSPFIYYSLICHFGDSVADFLLRLPLHIFTTEIVEGKDHKKTNDEPK